MADDLTSQRRGTRRLILGVIAAGLLIGVPIAVWPWLPGAPAPSAPTPVTGTRSHQTEGMSTVGASRPAPRDAGPQNTTPQATGFNEAVIGTSSAKLSLTDEQKQAVRNFVSAHSASKMDYTGFTMTVGAAVPQQIRLQDLPVELTDKLAGYTGDQYLIVPDQLIIVEKPTRRIVAIIPTTA